MKRAVLDKQRTLQEWRKHKQFIHPHGSTCECDEQPNRFRKRKALYEPPIYSNHRWNGEAGRLKSDRIADLSFQEQLIDPRL